MMTWSPRTPIALMSSVQAIAAAPAPFTTTLMSASLRSVRRQALIRPGGGDDRRAVLVVVEHRDVHPLAQRLLDDEAVGRGNVLEVDPAEARLEQFDAIDEPLRVLGLHLDVDRVDVGEALEQHRLAFHHRLGRERAEVAEAEDRGAVGDDGDEVALGGIIVGAGRDFRRSRAPGPRRRANKRGSGRAASPSAWWR